MLQPLYPWGRRPLHPVGRRLGGPKSQFGHGGKEKKSLSLPRIKSQLSSPEHRHYSELKV